MGFRNYTQSVTIMKLFVRHNRKYLQNGRWKRRERRKTYAHLVQVPRFWFLYEYIEKFIIHRYRKIDKSRYNIESVCILECNSGLKQQ